MDTSCPSSHVCVASPLCLSVCFISLFFYLSVSVSRVCFKTFVSCLLHQPPGFCVTPSPRPKTNIEYIRLPNLHSSYSHPQSVMASPAGLAQAFEMMQNNPAMAQMAQQMMQDPTALHRASQMDLGGAFAAGLNATGANPAQGFQPPSAGLGGMGGVPAAAPPAAATAPSPAPSPSPAPAPPAAATTGGGGGGEGDQEEKTEDELIAEAIRRSIED